MDKFTIMDLILLPKNVYKKINDKLFTLYIGVIFIGILYILPPALGKVGDLFINKPLHILIYNIALTATSVIFIGFINVVFFSLPLHDIFNKFRLESDFIDNSNKFVKLMKLYIFAHLLMIPVNILFYLTVLGFTLSPESAILIMFIVLIWFNAVITRGVNIIYSFETKFRSIVFILVFIWNFLLLIALGFIIDKLFILFK